MLLKVIFRGIWLAVLALGSRLSVRCETKSVLSVFCPLSRERNREDATCISQPANTYLGWTSPLAVSAWVGWSRFDVLDVRHGWMGAHGCLLRTSCTKWCVKVGVVCGVPFLRVDVVLLTFALSLSVGVSCLCYPSLIFNC